MPNRISTNKAGQTVADRRLFRNGNSLVLSVGGVLPPNWDIVRVKVTDSSETVVILEVSCITTKD